MLVEAPLHPKTAPDFKVKDAKEIVKDGAASSIDVYNPPSCLRGTVAIAKPSEIMSTDSPEVITKSASSAIPTLSTDLATHVLVKTFVVEINNGVLTESHRDSIASSVLNRSKDRTEPSLSLRRRPRRPRRPRCSHGVLKTESCRKCNEEKRKI